MDYRERLETFCSEYQRRLIREAYALIPMTMPEMTEELFSIYEKTGNRSAYEKVYFTRRKSLAILGLEAIREKTESGSITGKLLEKLSEVIVDVCHEECWALPAHLSRNNPDWRITIDLFASETAQTLSELYDRLEDTLHGDILTLIRENVESRVLIPFLSTERYGWEKSDHNWNAVCTGSIGSASMHLWGNCEQTDQCLNRVCDSLLYYLDGFADDGTCMEGCGYYTYGMSYFVNFAQELLEYTDGRMDLLRGNWGIYRAGETDKRNAIAAFQSKCFFLDGTVMNFSDGNRQDRFQVGLYLALKKRFPEMMLPELSAAADLEHDHGWRFVFRKLDLLEMKRYLDKEANGDGSGTLDSERRSVHILPDAQWCIAHGDNGVAMACKGGHNGEPHNHNDIGHFLYEAEGTALLADLGAGEYTKDYFGENRYEILCNSSFGHSVPILNGRGQVPGKNARCAHFEAQELPDRLWVCMDLSGAYGEQSGTVVRELDFSLRDGRLVVCDRFALADNQGSIMENLITQCRPIRNGDALILEGPSVSAELQGVDQRTLTIAEHSHSNHWGVMESVYAIQWTVSPESDCASFEIRLRNGV